MTGGDAPGGVAGLSLAELRDAAELAITIAAAAQAGIFHALAEAPASDDALAERLGLDRRAVRILLPVLAELGYLERRGGAYAPTETGRALLGDRASPRYVGGGLEFWLENVRVFLELPEALRTGRPAGELDAAPPDEESIARFMRGMAARPAHMVRRAVELALVRRPGATRALDVGGGPGLYARELLGAGVERVVLFDTPPTIAHVADAYGLGDVDGLTLAAGDFLEDPLPEGPFDLVLLSNILHMYSPEQNLALLHKVHGVLAPGGVVAIGDMVRGRSPRAARFAIVMLLRTGGGDTYTEQQHLDWLEEAGFEAVRLDDVDAERQLITATRR